MYAIVNRTRILFGLCLALLGGFALSPAYAISKGDMGQFRYNKSGSTITINPNQSGFGGATANISKWPSGATGTQIGQSGWYYGTAAASNPGTGPTMIMGHYGDVFFAGTKYPFQAGYQVPMSSLTTALGMLCSTPITCALAIATPAIADWLTSNSVKQNDNPAEYPEKPFVRKERFWDFGCNSSGYSDGPESAGCFGMYGNGMHIVLEDIKRDGNWCVVYIRCSDGSHPHTRFDTFYANNDEKEYMRPVTPAELAPLMQNPSNPADVIRDILDKGGDIDLPRPEVTGPSEIAGPTVTTKNPDGTTTTTQDKSNFKTQDNTITQTGTGKTDQKCDSSGKCDTTQTDEQDPNSAEKQKALCEQYPDILACAIGDIPKANIPKDSKEISYTPENIFGSGSCPADRYLKVTNGPNLKVWDWTSSCQKIVDLRPLVIALGGFCALMVLIPGLKGELV